MTIDIPSLTKARVACLSSYIPRKCGIANYTKDLTSHLNLLNPDRPVEIIAMDAPGETISDYPSEVHQVIRQNEKSDYVNVADYLNQSVIDLVLIQHEYGIFGGKDGNYLLELTSRLKKPFMVTLHTILPDPTVSQKNIIQILSEKAAKLIVMIPTAARLLTRIYGIDPERIAVIPHGTPDIPFVPDTSVDKQLLKLEDRIVMSSINLVSRGKGYENAIRAVAKVAAQYPNFLYLIIGQTHPEVLKKEGEGYRELLQELVESLGIEDNVRFVNKFVTKDELINYIKASDFYITPYDALGQISSGSLAYAVAAGKLCISTPYLYAQDVLAGGKGYLVSGKGTEIAQSLFHGIENPSQALLTRRKCYQFGRTMTWTKVAYTHLEIINTSRHPLNGEIPQPTFSYIRYLTDDVGMLEHSGDTNIYHHEGYSTDDNARALMAALYQGQVTLAGKYLNFMIEAQKDGLIFCDREYSGKWVGEPGTGDWFGRAILAGCMALREGLKEAKGFLQASFPHLLGLVSLKTMAFCLSGLSLLSPRQIQLLHPDGVAIRDTLAGRLMQAYRSTVASDWVWFENILTYDNGRLPQALLQFARVTGNKEAKDIGLASLDFLVDQTFDLSDNVFRFIGTKGWFPRGGTKAMSDEQPLEAGSTTEALIEAYALTEKPYYLEMAQKAFAWYHGDNFLRQPMINTRKQSVYDGLGPTLGTVGVNMNQGAESVLSYQLAWFAIHYRVAQRNGLMVPFPPFHRLNETG